MAKKKGTPFANDYSKQSKYDMIEYEDGKYWFTRHFSVEHFDDLALAIREALDGLEYRFASACGRAVSEYNDASRDDFKRERIVKELAEINRKIQRLRSTDHFVNKLLHVEACEGIELYEEVNGKTNAYRPILEEAKRNA